MSDPATIAPTSEAEKTAAADELLKQAEDLTAVQARTVADQFMAPTSDDSRFEDKRPDPPEEEEEAEEAGEQVGASNARWGNAPSVRNQIINHPDTVRMVEPQSAVIDPSIPDQLTELNRIQKESSREEDPKLAITEYERKFHDGKWSVFLTYSKIQYRQI